MKDENGHGLDPGITDEIADNLAHAFQVGAVVSDAAAYAGIKQRTLESWITKGRRGEEPYRALIERLDEARGYGNIRSLTVLATSDDWRAHRARLAFQDKGYVERRFIEGRVEHRHSLDVAGLSDADLEALRGILERAGVPAGEVIEDAEVLEVTEGALHDSGGSVT